ncbi:MAG: peptide-methionine (S)-S-oxide reductase [Chthoniobacterales bacterium]
MKINSLLTFAIVLLAQTVALLAEQENAEPNKVPTKRVAFAQSCFWTGEMKLGQIEGVVRTEAGYFKGREVTVVHYAPERVALEELAHQAKRAGVADTVYLDADSPQTVAGISSGPALDRTYRAAPADDQKKQIQGTSFSRLQLTPEQATKVNAFARENTNKAMVWLTPAQREQLKGGR